MSETGIRKDDARDATIIIAGGGQGRRLASRIEKAKADLPEEEARRISTVAFDLDGAPPADGCAPSIQFGTVVDPDAGGADDPSVLGGVPREVRPAAELVDRRRGGGGNRLVALGGLRDDAASAERVVRAVELKIREAAALSPGAINVIVAANLGGSVGSAFVSTAPAIIRDAYTRSGVVTPITSSAIVLPPAFLPAGVNVADVGANALAALLEARGIAAGLIGADFFSPGAPTLPYSSSTLLLPVRCPRRSGRSSSEELQREQEASFVGSARLMVAMQTTGVGELVGSRLLNNAAAREGCPRVVASHAVGIPRGQLSGEAAAGVVISVLSSIVRTKDGEPQIATPPASAIAALTASGPEEARALLIALRGPALETVQTEITTPDWRAAARVLGVDPDALGLTPVSEIPVGGRLRRGSLQERLSTFVEDVTAVEKTSCESLGQALAAAQVASAAGVTARLAATAVDILNGSGALSAETHRPGLVERMAEVVASTASLLRARWERALQAAISVPDGLGGFRDRRKELEEEFRNILDRVAASSLLRLVPALSRWKLGQARAVADERLSLRLLEVAVEALGGATERVNAGATTVGRAARDMGATLTGALEEAISNRDAALQELGDDADYGGRDHVGVDEVRKVLAPVVAAETSALTRNITFNYADGRFTGTVAGTPFEEMPGATPVNERNYGLLSASALAATKAAAREVDLYLEAAKAYGTPGRLMARLRSMARPGEAVAGGVIRSDRQPAALGLLALPRVPTPAGGFVAGLKLTLGPGEEVVETEISAGDELRLTAVVGGVELPGLKPYRAWARPYLQVGRPVHFVEALERSRDLSKAVYAAEGLVWVPRVEVSLLLSDVAFLRDLAVALGAGLVRTKEIWRKDGTPKAVYTVNGAKAAGPDVSVTGMEFISGMKERKVRGALGAAVAAFDRKDPAARIRILAPVAQELPPAARRAFGRDADLVRLVQLTLRGEVARIGRLLPEIVVDDEG